MGIPGLAVWGYGPIVDLIARADGGFCAIAGERGRVLGGCMKYTSAESAGPAHIIGGEPDRRAGFATFFHLSTRSMAALTALTALVFIPTTTLLALSLDAGQAEDALRAECIRTYSEEACTCAAPRIAQALGPLTPGEAEASLALTHAGDVIGRSAFADSRTRAIAVSVVQSCMAGGDAVAD